MFKAQFIKDRNDGNGATRIHNANVSSVRWLVDYTYHNRLPDNFDVRQFGTYSGHLTLVTPQGVAIIDFGSAIRFGEDITQSRVLAKVFAQMLDASQIAEDLRRLRKRKRVTSSVFRYCFKQGHPGCIGPAIDLFALVHQMTRPHDNPDLLGLVDADPNQPGYEPLAQLRRDILKPEHPETPSIQRVCDLVEAIQAM